MPSEQYLTACRDTADLPRELHERLLLRNEQTKQFNVGEVYVPHDNAKRNVQTWMNSQFTFEAVPNIIPVGLTFHV